MSRSWLMIIWLLLCANAYGQPQVIEGIITDAKTGEPLIGAVVRIGNSGSTTGIDGRFSLNAQILGDCKISISYVGYRAADIPCNPGQYFYRIALESDFVSLGDVQVKAKKFEISELFDKVIKRIPENYESSKKPLSGQYLVVLHNSADTQLVAKQRVYLYKNGGIFNNYYFNYSAYQVKGATIRPDKGEITQKKIDNYIYNVLGRLTGRWDKYLKSFIGKENEYDIISSTFNILNDKYYDLVLISRHSKRISEAALRGNRTGNGVLDRQYIWLREFRIHAESMAVTFYQEIMIESDRDGYTTLVNLKDRNLIDDWLHRMMDENIRYTNYKLVFKKMGDKWQLRKESYRDSYWNPFNSKTKLPPLVYYFEYDMKNKLDVVPKSVEKFNPDIVLKRYAAGNGPVNSANNKQFSGDPVGK